MIRILIAVIHVTIIKLQLHLTSLDIWLGVHKSWVPGYHGPLHFVQWHLILWFLNMNFLHITWCLKLGGDSQINRQFVHPCIWYASYLGNKKGYCSCCILFLQPFGSAVVLLSSSGGVSREFSHLVNSFSCCTIHSSSKYTELVVNGSVVLVASKRPGFASLLRTASGLWSWTLSSFCFLVFGNINLVHSVRGTEELELLRSLLAGVSVSNRNNSMVDQTKLHIMYTMHHLRNSLICMTKKFQKGLLKLCNGCGEASRTLTLRRLMSYIYGAPILDVSRSHTTTQHSR